MFGEGNFFKITAFGLIVIGTAGLLLNEFVWEPSSTRAIIFAVVNLVGLVILGFAQFGMWGKWAGELDFSSGLT